MMCIRCSLEQRFYYWIPLDQGGGDGLPEGKRWTREAWRRRVKTVYFRLTQCRSPQRAGPSALFIRCFEYEKHPGL